MEMEKMEKMEKNSTLEEISEKEKKEKNEKKRRRDYEIDEDGEKRDCKKPKDGEKIEVEDKKDDTQDKVCLIPVFFLGTNNGENATTILLPPKFRVLITDEMIKRAQVHMSPTFYISDTEKTVKDLKKFIECVGFEMHGTVRSLVHSTPVAIESFKNDIKKILKNKDTSEWEFELNCAIENCKD
jgi:hypothetical protein